MADRESRFQMRQRGAGARNVDDFSFNIGTVSSDHVTTPENVSTSSVRAQNLVIGDNVARQQRFEMRRRGAGARDVDFTLDLGVPVASSPTGRVSVAGSTKSTGSNTRPELQVGAATIAPSSLRSFLAPVAQMAAVDDDGTITKRRRLSPEAEEELAEEAEDEALFVGDDGDIQDHFAEGNSVDSVAVSANSPAAGSTGSTKRRKKKKSVLRKPKKRKGTNSGSSVASSVIAEEDGGEVRQALMENRNLRQSIQAIPERSPSLEDADGEPEEMVEQLSTRNKEPGVSSEQSKYYNIFDRANRPAAAPTIPAVQRILSEHGVSNKENRPLNIPTKPRTANRTKKPAKAKKSASKDKESKSQTTHGLQEQDNQVVITVHRVSNLSRLNFITEEDDELVTDQIPHPRQKKSPNGIDVLAQICREVIDKHIKALSTDSRLKQDGQKNILKRQIETFRRFDEELASRLLMMTTALDHNTSLTHNVKEATRLKAQHRTTLLDLRKQRQDIELQQDAIRAANEAEATQAAERFELNTMLGDIQLAVQRGRDNTDTNPSLEEPRESLTMRLQRVGEVVGTTAKKSLLMRVREVNALLEGLLEKRV